METSSYLFTSIRKKRKKQKNLMDKRSDLGSNISLDSLETNFKKKTSLNDKTSDENVETILVPFYEKDLLIKVPKDPKKRNDKSNEKQKKKTQCNVTNYLVNKDRKRSASYLQMFRKQFFLTDEEKSKTNNEIRSLSPECGDTEWESFSENASNQVLEFFNSECYNEIYYEKILNEQNENNFEEELKFNQDIKSKSPEESVESNLRSVSEISQRGHHARRATVQPIYNVKLGGLGPDMERIKPRLERARSLQRYSEKVRMENRVKIYKRAVQCENDQKEKVSLVLKREANKVISSKDHNKQVSYLVNKSEDIKTKGFRKVYDLKSNSADIQRSRARMKDKEKMKNDPVNKINENKNKEREKVKQINRGSQQKKEIEKSQGEPTPRAKSSARNRGINTDLKIGRRDIPPVQISFQVNVGGVRPSSALRTLEEKHRMFQKQVKGFTLDN